MEEWILYKLRSSTQEERHRRQAVALGRGMARLHHTQSEPIQVLLIPCLSTVHILHITDEENHGCDLAQPGGIFRTRVHLCQVFVLGRDFPKTAAKGLPNLGIRNPANQT